MQHSMQRSVQRSVQHSMQHSMQCSMQRSMQGWEKFSTFKQKPGMSTEKIFTEFHLLKNEAKNELEFELPAQLLTATLMKACTDIPPDQIGIITETLI